jgi:hypothetical protein
MNSQSTSRSRRVRPTLQCLADLGVDVPPPPEPLDDVSHPVLEKARALAAAHPENQVRIQGIGDAMVYRFTHGRLRALTWLDPETEILWVCGVDMRRENEGYDLFISRHRDGALLPGEGDVRRLEDEAILELVRAIRDGAPHWVEEARARPDVEVQFTLPGGASIRMYYTRSEGVEALWAAIPTLLAAELGLPDRARALVVASISEVLGGTPDDLEQRYDWPTGSLQNFEVAFFWLR